MTATLAIDLGGTKILAALVDGSRVLDRALMTTDRDSGPEAWLRQMAEVARGWRSRFVAAGISVTGLVRDGLWSAMNPRTLAVPDDFPILDRARDLLEVPVVVVNDAQAAAWGEYRFGAGARRDLVFLTVSTGVGGGIVLGGQLIVGRGGLAGHFGQATFGAGARVEDRMSGSWIAAEAEAAGRTADARAVFAAAAEGAAWAEEIVARSARRIARLCTDIQIMLDPEVIVIGGGVGLAPGYLDRIADGLSGQRPNVRPTLAPAALGPDAGIIGVAALSRQKQGVS